MHINHDVSGLPAGDDATYGGGVAAASAKTGKLAVAAQPQVHPKGRKRSRPPNHALGSPQHPGVDTVLPLCWEVQPCSVAGSCCTASVFENTACTVLHFASGHCLAVSASATIEHNHSLQDYICTVHIETEVRYLKSQWLVKANYHESVLKQMCVCVCAAPVYFHARSCSRMTPKEVAQVHQDPNALPDNDDEEEDRERSKVRDFAADNHERLVFIQCHQHQPPIITA